jgi:hypothetical protein
VVTSEANPALAAATAVAIANVRVFIFVSPCTQRPRSEAVLSESKTHLQTIVNGELLRRRHATCRPAYGLAPVCLDSTAHKPSAAIAMIFNNEIR